MPSVLTIRGFLAATVPQLLLAVPVAAGVCTVPGTHALVQLAIDDPACGQIQLADQTYDESITIDRSLTLAGPAGGDAILSGRVGALGAGVLAAVLDLAVETSCSPALLARSGARIDGSGLTVLRSAAFPCSPGLPIFADGFESGDSSAWDAVVE